MLSIIQAAGWPIWPLVACSILALALVIERFISLKTSKIAPPQLLEEVLSVCRTSVPAPDVVSQLEKNSALGEVLASGFRALNNSPRCSEDDLRSSMEGAGRVVAHRLERYLSALATIASAAPLMGLFGTVVGMIEIFGAQTPAGGATGEQLLAFTFASAFAESSATLARSRSYDHTELPSAQCTTKASTTPRMNSATRISTIDRSEF